MYEGAYPSSHANKKGSILILKCSHKRLMFDILNTGVLTYGFEAALFNVVKQNVTILYIIATDLQSTMVI